MKKRNSIVCMILCILMTIGLTATCFAAGNTGIKLTLDTPTAEAGNLPSTVKMTVSTDAAIAPVSISGEAYSDNAKITLTKIADGDKELSAASTETGRFAWMNGRNEKTFSEWAVITYAIPADLPAGTYTLGVRDMAAKDGDNADMLAKDAATTTFTVTAPQTPDTPETDKVNIVLSLDKTEVKNDVANTIVMYVKTDKGTVPVSISGEAYAANSGITLAKIADGDKELSAASTETGRFAWMNANNTKTVTEWAEVSYTIPANFPVGTYTLGVREMSAVDADGSGLLAADSKTITFKVVKGDVAVSDVTIDAAAAEMETGKTQKLSATVKPADATDKTVTWTSSNPAVATVAADGTVTALKAGTVTITAKAGDKTAEFTITIKDAVVPVSGITITDPVKEMKTGETAKNTAAVTPANATDKTITWTSSDPAVATVAADGTVTALKAGTVTITAKAGDKTAQFTITITEPTLIEDFVTRFYRIVLERVPDAEGHKTWSEWLEEGKVEGSSIALGFFDSAEYENKKKSNEDFVEDLYLAFFDRPSDPEGKAAWVSLLNMGVSRDTIIMGFLGSDEYQKLCADAGITCSGYFGVMDFVERMYTKCLDRESDIIGKLTWTGLLIRTGLQPELGWTGEKVAYGFFMSDEFIAKKYTNTKYIQVLYSTIFDREPDVAGLGTWVELLSSGKWTREQVLFGFTRSAEFQELCAKYGIIAFQ